MTLYPRSDVMGVSLSRDHGGCGATHTRPVTHGAPVKVWALNCPPCEDHLRSDPNWAVDAEEIPETPDEVKLRESREKRGEKTVAANLEASIASLASSQEGIQKLMTVMTAALAGANPAIAQALSALTSVATAPFEGEDADAADHAVQIERNELVEDLLTDDPRDAHSEGAFDAPDLTKLTVKDLRALASERGLANTGNRAQLLERLNETS